MESQVKEFMLRVPRDSKKFNIMRMNCSSAVDMSTLNEVHSNNKLMYSLRSKIIM
jgi:hypothetical protein